MAWSDCGLPWKSAILIMFCLTNTIPFNGASHFEQWDVNVFSYASPLMQKHEKQYDWMMLLLKMQTIIKSKQSFNLHKSDTCSETK